MCETREARPWARHGHLAKAVARRGAVAAARFQRVFNVPAALLSLGRAVTTIRGLAGASELLHTMSTTSVRQNKAIALFDAGLAIVAATRCPNDARALDSPQVWGANQRTYPLGT